MELATRTDYSYIASTIEYYEYISLLQKLRVGNRNFRRKPVAVFSAQQRASDDEILHYICGPSTASTDYSAQVILSYLYHAPCTPLLLLRYRYLFCSLMIRMIASFFVLVLSSCFTSFYSLSLPLLLFFCLLHHLVSNRLFLSCTHSATPVQQGVSTNFALDAFELEINNLPHTTQSSKSNNQRVISTILTGMTDLLISCKTSLL